MKDKVKLLTFTTLYPNAMQPSHGIFVEQRLRHLVASGNVDARVIAPVPWFPFKHSRFGRYALFTRVPYKENRHGINISHPRYPVIPKLGMTLAPLLLARATKSVLREVIKNDYDFDVIDAHYFYPDGVAAVMLGRSFGKPVCITARGTDINVIPKYRIPRKMILWAGGAATARITVCQALKDRLVDIGVSGNDIMVFRNGVDLQLFRPPVDRNACRQQLGLDRRTLLSVGHLVGHKGHDIVIKALSKLPEVQLIIVGDGEEEDWLRAIAKSLGVSDRVIFSETVLQENMKSYYGAADALVLASSREGWPNVLLEAMACGTPVIATKVGGIPELITAPEAGVLMRERTPEALLEAFHELFANYPSREATRRYAQHFDWEEPTRQQVSLFKRIMAREDMRY